MGKECKYHAHFMITLIFETGRHGCFELNAIFRIAAQFFFSTCVLKMWFELSRVKFYRNDLKGNKDYSWRKVRVTEGKSAVNV